MDFAILASTLKVPSFGLLSYRDADVRSFLNYRKVKGKVEQDIKALQLPVLTIYRPGLILNNQNDYYRKSEENVLFYIPYIAKIDAADLGRFILLDQIDKGLLGYDPRNVKVVVEIEHEEIVKKFCKRVDKRLHLATLY